MSRKTEDPNSAIAGLRRMKFFKNLPLLANRFKIGKIVSCDGKNL
jgi:hypothetical protein